LELLFTGCENFEGKDREKNTNLKSQQKKTYQRTINKKKKDNRVIFKTNKKFHRKQARENVQLNKH
jgi:hypothetical protein